MKYTEDGCFYSFSNRFERENSNAVPINKSVWGFAYKIDNETGYKHLSCLPELGEVVEYDRAIKISNKLPNHTQRFFIPYKKDSTLFKKSGIVSGSARYYADTYEEAVEGYNSLVIDRMKKLDEMMQECVEDLLGKRKENEE